MWILLLPLFVFVVMAVGVGVVAAVQAQSRLERKGQWILYGILLGLSLVPTWMHYEWAIRFASSYGVSHPDQPAGFYPGLQRFQLVVPVAGAFLWFAAWLASRRIPLLAALLPGAAYVGYFHALSWVVENPPGVMLDNKPTIVLFLANAAAVLGLATYVLAVWGRPLANWNARAARGVEALHEEELTP